MNMSKMLIIFHFLQFFRISVQVTTSTWSINGEKYEVQLFCFKDNLSVLKGTLSRKIFRKRSKLPLRRHCLYCSKTFLLLLLILHFICIPTQLIQTQRLYSTSYHEDSKQLTQQDRVGLVQRQLELLQTLGRTRQHRKHH